MCPSNHRGMQQHCPQQQLWLWQPYNYLIESFGSANHPEAMKVFREMQQQVVVPTVTYNGLINLLLKANQPEKAMEVLREMLSEKALEMLREAPNVTTFNSLIDAFGSAEMPAQAMEVFRMLEQPNDITYNVMINALLKANRPEQAMEVLREMWQRGIYLPTPTNAFW